MDRSSILPDFVFLLLALYLLTAGWGTPSPRTKGEGDDRPISSEERVRINPLSRIFQELRARDAARATPKEVVYTLPSRMPTREEREHAVLLRIRKGVQGLFYCWGEHQYHDLQTLGGAMASHPRPFSVRLEADEGVTVGEAQALWEFCGERGIPLLFGEEEKASP